MSQLASLPDLNLFALFSCAEEPRQLMRIRAWPELCNPALSPWQNLPKQRLCLGRYQRGSEMCQKLARSLQQLTTEEERGLFDFGARHGETAPLVSLWQT